MGDMSEYRGLIVAGTLLGCFGILSMAIPASLYTAASMRILAPPDYFEIEDLYYFSSSTVVNLTGTLSGTGYPPGTWIQVDVKDEGGESLGGWDIDLFYRLGEDPDLRWYLIHMHTEWFGFVGADHGFNYLNDNGVSRGNSIELSELESDMDDGNARYKASCEHTRITIVAAYNTTSYSSAEHAWDNEGLAIFFGVHFDDENTGFNAMSLIASILFFDMPAVHWTINTLIAIPLWIAIGYISIILILRAIDALPFT